MHPITMDLKSAVNGGMNGLTDFLDKASNSFATALQGIFGVIVAVFLIWGAVILLTASGDSNKIQEAKDKFKYALIALAVVMLSDRIVGFVMGLLKS